MTTKKPWKKTAPRKSGHTKLTPESKSKAKAAARRAGRSYPNLVDNMQAAKKQRVSSKKKS
jgi:ribosomal protein L15E